MDWRLLTAILECSCLAMIMGLCLLLRRYHDQRASTYVVVGYAAALFALSDTMHHALLFLAEGQDTIPGWLGALIMTCSALYDVTLLNIAFTVAISSWRFYSPISWQIPVLRVGFCALYALLQLLVASTPFHGLVEIINLDEGFNPGPLFFLLPLGFFAMMLLALWFPVVSLGDSGRQRRRAVHEKIVTALCLILVMLAELMDLMIDETLVLPMCTLLTLISAIHFQRRQISLDGLTGLRNQENLIARLKVRYRIPGANQHLFVALFSLPWLTRYTEQAGYRKSSELAMAFAEMMRSCTRELRSCAVRYRDDEFLVLLDPVFEADAEDYVGRVEISFLDLAHRHNLPQGFTLRTDLLGTDRSMQFSLDLVDAIEHRLYLLRGDE
ncbi:MAG: GGDEF domain-containing protein [Succinivibrionaceae bacterium]|nr:GGDEF domain-containing protein [Succinivibrionaceae bacterium]